jgi:hypothetical protein
VISDGDGRLDGCPDGLGGDGRLVLPPPPETDDTGSEIFVWFEIVVCSLWECEREIKSRTRRSFSS